MAEQQTRETVVNELSIIAPELDPAALRHDKPLRDQVDLDSFDWLKFLIAVHNRIKVDIPEQDYARLVTVDDLVSYLESKLGSS
jgi:acyl carrier protein